ncbi:hypothetical protein G7Y79_00031g065950 [Physcia stellaris]|nr:hypothetical protein G7Y79_00031g065950 [Physcia stellaris]
MSPCRRPIVLDTTLHDLYSLDGADKHNVVLVIVLPSSRLALTPSIPISKIFAYQDSRRESGAEDKLAASMVQIVPQELSFAAGKMPLIYFDVGGNHIAPGGCSTLSDAHRNVSQLAAAQQPDLRILKGPKDIHLLPGEKIAIFNPMDCLLHLPHLVDPEIHYGLLSKKDLALSRLPVPASEIIMSRLKTSEISDDRLVAEEAERMINIIKDRRPPFVVKMPQAISSYGTFLARTELEKRKVIQLLEEQVKILLRQTNEWNAHMSPSSLIIQDYIPSETVPVAFFITRSGRSIFIGCARQGLDSKGLWERSSMSYREQDRLQREYASIIDVSTTYIFKKGYYGPVGLDVMTDASGQHLIVDFNIRSTASQMLGFFKNHFSRDRGLHEAAIFSRLDLGCTRDQFEKDFEEEFNSGSLIIIGWAHLRKSKSSLACVVMAAEDKEKLSIFAGRLEPYRIKDASLEK